MARTKQTCRINSRLCRRDLGGKQLPQSTESTDTVNSAPTPASAPPQPSPGSTFDQPQQPAVLTASSIDAQPSSAVAADAKTPSATSIDPNVLTPNAPPPAPAPIPQMPSHPPETEDPVTTSNTDDQTRTHLGNVLMGLSQLSRKSQNVLDLVKKIESTSASLSDDYSALFEEIRQWYAYIQHLENVGRGMEQNDADGNPTAYRFHASVDEKVPVVATPVVSAEMARNVIRDAERVRLFSQKSFIRGTILEAFSHILITIPLPNLRPFNGDTPLSHVQHKRKPVPGENLTGSSLASKNKRQRTDVTPHQVATTAVATVCDDDWGVEDDDEPLPTGTGIAGSAHVSDDVDVADDEIEAVEAVEPSSSGGTDAEVTDEILDDDSAAVVDHDDATATAADDDADIVSHETADQAGDVHEDGSDQLDPIDSDTVGDTAVDDDEPARPDTPNTPDIVM